MRDSLRHSVAEFIGTFALVFIGGAAIMVARQSGGSVGLLEIALAHGLVLAIMVSALMRISGHFNPAVTIGFLATRRIEPTMAAVYVVSQILGAVAASYALKSTMPGELFMATRGGGQSVALDVTAAQAFMLEMIATFFLVIAIFGTAVDPEAPRVGGFAIGLVLTMDILAIGPFTGGSMNPARSFGPAVASNIYEGQLIYWLAPIVGALLAALIYDRLFLPRAPEPLDHGALEPGRGAPRVHGV